MTSSIINYVIDKFLSNFLEINPNQTSISLLSGEFVLKNVKIKKSSFEYVNIDYLELVNGYIGSIKVLLQMPNFYSNPMKIYINDLYVYAKQKKIKNINEKERIDYLIANKLYRLSLDEQINHQIDEINSQDGGNFVNQIINNLNIFVHNIVFRFDDTISSPYTPFSVGLIAKSFHIISFEEFYNNNNINEEINYLRRSSTNKNIDTKNLYISDNLQISDKKIIVNKFYLYMDCFNKKEDLQYEKFIDETVKIQTSQLLDNYINEISHFYYYCQSELNTHCNNKNAHEYMIYKLNLDINFSWNFELENNNPQYQMYFNDIDNFNIYLTVKQISSFFNLLSYYNLYYYYQLGLNKSIFNVNLNQTERKTYTLDYIDYYYMKYIKKNNAYNLSNFIKEKEAKMSYEDIIKLRKVAIKNINLYKEIKDIEEKIEKLKGSWFFYNSNKNEINDLENTLLNLKKSLNNKIIKLNKNKSEIKINRTSTNNSLNKTNSKLLEESIINEDDPYKNLPDNFILTIIQMNIKKSNFIIYDDEYEENNINKKYKKIIDVNFINFFIKMSIGIKLFNISFNISDLEITQYIVKSNDYNVMLMSKPANDDKENKDKKILIFEFEINSNENYTYKIILKNERKIYFIFNLYELQYIQYKILGAIYTSISFIDLSHYAEGNINKYLRIGYLINEEKYKSRKNATNYYNYYCDINILSPIIVIPQNMLDIYNNKCIIINLGDITLKSNLVSSTIRKFLENTAVNTDTIDYNKNFDDFSSSNDSNYSDDIYDIYDLYINGFNVLISNESLKNNLFVSKFSSSIIQKTDISILYKTLIAPGDKQLNNTYLNITINKVELYLDEFQILFLIVFSKIMKAQSYVLYKMQEKRETELNVHAITHSNTRVKEIYKEHLIEKGILAADNIETDNEEEKKNKNNKNIKKIKNYTKEEDFLTRKNDYFYEININKIKFTIFKNYPDLSNKIFLETEITSFVYIMSKNLIDDYLMKISLKNLILYDKEKNINNEYILIKEYRTLIKNNKNLNNNDNMFTYSNIYNDSLKENKSELKLCSIDIIITVDSLTRIYIFSMYYYKMFYENYLNTNQPKGANKQKPLLKGNHLLDLDTNDIIFKQSSSFENKDLKNEQYKYEIIKNKYIFQIKIIDNFFLIPYNPSSLTCPILSLKLNMLYDQSYIDETINIYENLKKKCIKTIVRPNNSYLNLMIYESDFDIIKYNNNKKEFSNNKKINKIISNYRIQFTNKYSNLIKNNQSLSDIDILIEPIIINIYLDQLKNILLFYYQSMEFLYEKLYEYYIPYIKPENVAYYKGKAYVKKKKITFKKIACRVFILIKIRKSFNNKNRKIKNLNVFNSVSSINIKMPKSTITIFDRTLVGKRSLLEIKLTKMFFKSINNTNPKNLNNVTNELLSILTGTTVPFKNYIVHNLYNYMDISFLFEFNYYNLEYNSFEPIIEPLPFQYLSYQVDKIFRHKTIIKSDNMLNFNISSNCIKVLNLFLSKYYSEVETSYRGSTFNMIKKNSIENDLLEKDDKIILRLLNETGLPIRFWFDFKSEEKYILNNKEFLNFTNRMLYKTRREQIKIQQKTLHKNSFSFQILGYEIIQNINFNKNTILNFKTLVGNNKYLLYRVILDSSGLVNQVKFYSSINFYNKTIFDEMIISIDDNTIKDNYMILNKGKKTAIPLNWMLSDKKIYIQLSKNNKKNILYNNIFDCIFCKELNRDELEKKEKEKIKIKENITNRLNDNKDINLQHPKYKEYISEHAEMNFNKTMNKKSIQKITIIDEKEKNKSYSFSLNYLALSYKGKTNKNNEEIYNKLTNTKRTYNYLIIIRPIIGITNYIPFNIMLNTSFNNNNNQNNNINLSPLETEEIYDINWTLNKNSLFKLCLNYDDNIFSSNDFPLMEDTKEHLLKKVVLRDKKLNSIISNIFVKTSDEKKDFFLQTVEQFSISSIHFVLFFDYIINNRMELDIFSKILYKEKNNNQTNLISLFRKKKLSLLSSFKDIYKINLSATDSIFDEKNQFILNSIGLNKNIELLKDNRIYNISCTTLSSVDFIYSDIILFEPKYILINNLDLDVYYIQITKDKKRFIKKIKKGERNILSYIKENDKKIFKIGMKIKDKYSWSGPFNIDDSKDYDYKIEIDNEFMNKYRRYTYTYGNKYYFYFHIKFNIYQYTSYILLCFQEFPELGIINRTSETIKVYEKENGTPIIVEPRKDIPFIWEDVTTEKNKLICKIKEKKYNFSYSIFEEEKIKVNKKKYIILAVRRNKTGSRCLILEEKEIEHKFSSYFMKKQLKILSEMVIDLKGIGLSFLDETPKEIFFISFYGIKLVYKKTQLLKTRESIEQINFYLKNFQIDYCLNDSLKSLIYPKIQIIPSLEEQNYEEYIDFIMIFIERTSHYNLENNLLYMNYNRIALCIQEMNVKINQIILMNLINLIQGYTSLLDYTQKIKKKNDFYIKEENLIENNDKYIEKIIKEKNNSNKTLINYLILSSLKINLTFRIDFSNLEISFLPDIISNTLISLGSSLIRITESPLSFNPKVIQDIYMDINIIISILIKEFTTEGIFQIYRILGSTDLIGNPINLIDKIGNGFVDLVKEPTKGLLQGPTQFGKGLAKGVTGLLNGVVGGTMDSVSKITGTLYTTVHGILGKKEEILIDEEDEPANLLIGATKGIEGGYQELKEGVTGFFVNPFQRAKESGAIGFIQGLSTGIFGLAISPFAFALKLGGSLAAGTKNTFGNLYNKSLKNKRFRFPRYIEEFKPLQVYDGDLSAAKEFLRKLIEIENPTILYFSSFICNNEGYNEKLAFLIVTNELFIILSHKNDILLNIYISDLKNINLCYEKANFIIVFELKNKSFSNKKLIIDKSCVVIACHFYDILKDEINLLS